MRSIQDLMAGNSVFSSLSVDKRAELANQAIQKKVWTEKWVAPYGEVWPYLFLVVEGEIHALKASSEGRSLIVMTLGSGDVFWGMGFFVDEAEMPVLLQAQTECDIVMWSREQMMPWLLENGRISWELARLMAARMLRASDIVEELAFQPVRGRLARLLLEHYGEAEDEFVTRDLSLDQMAARVGTKREMVCRLLYQFAADGAIEISRTEFMIANREKLEESAMEAKG